MKITKKFLREMIIQEWTNDYQLAIDGGGKEMARSDFQSTSFEDDVTRIWSLLDDMETIVREDKLLKTQDIQYFRDHHLDNLSKKIGMVASAIDARVAGKFDEVE
jgi:hypothetical protein